MKSANGTIFGGVIRQTNQPIVVKQFPKKSISEFQRVCKRKCPSEVYYHFCAYQLDPQVIIKPIDWFENGPTYLMIMERPVGWIDMFEFANRFGAQSEETAKIIWSQLVRTAEKMHAGGICHSDIKDENVLINPHTLQIKLIDFGCAQAVKPVYTKSRGTPHYWPPEWFSTKEYRAEPLTVWSLGSILYILLIGEWKMADGALQRNFKREFRLSRSGQKLLNSMLCRHDASRITLKNILKSNWLK